MLFNEQEQPSLDIIFGEYRDQSAVERFVAAIRGSSLTGTLYIGYPVLSVDDERIEFDALLVSDTNGVIVFDLYSYKGEAIASNGGPSIPKNVSTRQEQLYAALFNKLNSFKELRQGRKLLVEILTATIHPIASTFENTNDCILLGLDQFEELTSLSPEEPLADDQVSHLNAAVQRISNLRPKKSRSEVTNQDSKGGKIKEIESQIANLDLWQKRGSIEYVNGPQRIRGLAGSGKTVVLALKAAYLHVKRPDWTIVVTFNTRSLYQQFESLINRFVYSQIGEEPDWTKIRIMHAWGASGRDGVYRDIAESSDSTFRDFGSASRIFGYEKAFEGACDELLNSVQESNFDLYDMVLIDEAQDLPSAFFKLVYKSVKSPKRIVWAYDDLQNLGFSRLPSPADLFGCDSVDRPLVTLSNEADKSQGDIVLPRCYRNPPWTLLAAHGVGFGIKRTPFAQMFTEPSIWEKLGYQATEGSLDFGQDVSLKRNEESVPEFFDKLLSPEDTLTLKTFETDVTQYNWVAEQISKMIEFDELQHSDFLIVLPDVITSKSIGSRLATALRNQNLPVHIPGLTSSRDEIFREGSIAITHIYRAKGNEAPVVFVVNANYCESESSIKRKRNILFTAITRSRAWTYITGVGADMVKLEKEFTAIRADDFNLKFHYPSRAEVIDLAVSSDQFERADKDDEAFDDLRTTLSNLKKSGKQIPLDLIDTIKEMTGGE